MVGYAEGRHLQKREPCFHRIRSVLGWAYARGTRSCFAYCSTDFSRDVHHERLRVTGITIFAFRRTGTVAFIVLTKTATLEPIRKSARCTEAKFLFVP